jgi:steroid 5-alpha reductase family enzyme
MENPSMTFGCTLFVAFLISSFVMGLTWAYAKKINNYSIVDAVWALSFALLTAIYAVLGNGFWQRRALILVCVGFWGLRLGIFLWKRIQGHHPKEDGRYLELREKYKPNVERGFFWFFQYQAWSVVLLTIPFLLICENGDSHLQTSEWIGVALWALSLTGEAIADHQAKAFKSDPKNAKRVCDQGLWKYSRHPNYFFESCVWWSYFIIALSSPHGIFTVYCPLIMLFLLLKVTGVPLSEAQSLKSRGDAYRAYQKRTSVFIPWFQKLIVLIFAVISATFLSVDNSRAASAPVKSSSDFIAKIYAVGKTNEAPVFVQKTHSEFEPDGTTHTHTDITDAEAKVVLSEDAVTKGEDLITQSVDKFQSGEHYDTFIKNEHVIFREKDKGSDKVKESSEGLLDNFTSGPTAEAFLKKHWDEILKGKTVSARFAVNEVRETIGFDFKMKGRKKIGDVDAVWITMSPSSVFISLVASDFDLFLDPKEIRYVKFIGRTPLKTKVDGKLKPFDGEILYQY